MKSHTSEFKEEIKTLGKQQSVRITYKENNVIKTLTDEDINSVTPNYEASLLKSVMKVLELDSNISIPKNTEIKFEYGLLVNGAYEYLDYGNYIVAKEPEKQEDTLSYIITCYDKMLYSMKDYEHIDIPYPCTIKQYLVALCNKIGLQFKDSDFANAGRQITSELFMTINEDGTYNSMGYTYRDVLDQIAETTGGCICITLDDKVEVRYINKTINYETSKKSTNIEFESSVKEIVKIQELDGKSTQDGTPTPSNPVEIKSIGDDINIINDADIINGSLSSGNIVSGYGYRLVTNNPIPVKSSTDCNINFRNIGEFKGVRVGIHSYDAEGNFISDSGWVSFTNLQATIKTGANWKSVRFVFSFSKTSTSVTTGGTEYTGNITPDEFKTFKVKFQEGSKATGYSKYGEGTLNIEQAGKNKLINSSFRENTIGWSLTNNGTIAPEITEKLGQKCLHITGELQKAKYFGQYIQTRVEKVKTYTLSAMVYLENYVPGTTNPFISFYTDGKTIAGSWTSGIQTLKGYLNFNNSNYDYSKGFVKITSTFKIKEDTDLTKALGVFIYARDFTGDLYVYDVQLEEGTEATNYEEYFNNTYTLPLSEPLRSLPNGVKDTLEADGIHRRVGRDFFKAITTIEENSGLKFGTYLVEHLGVLTRADNINMLCTKAKCQLYPHIENSIYLIGVNKKTIVIFGSSDDTVETFNTKFAGTEFLYELETETVEPYTDEQKEIISSMVTEKGTNIFELESNAILNYPVNYDTINEEYINDTNVNFGEKYRTY